MRPFISFVLCTFAFATAYAQPGSVDHNFDTGLGMQTTGEVEAIAIQPDGKIIAVGGFLTYDGQPSKNIVRINTDGTRDASFAVGSGFYNSYPDPSGVTGRCYSVAVQPDGKILVGASATMIYNDTVTKDVIRLNPNGSIDHGFTVGSGFNSIVRDFLVQTDGSILCSGQFSSFNGTDRRSIARLLPNGTLDTSFVPPTINTRVSKMALLSDGKVLIGGTFTTMDGLQVGSLARLNNDGSRDAGFPQGQGFNSRVRAIHVLDDGRIMVGGGFTFYDGGLQERIVRLLPDGSVDATFQASIGSGSNEVRAILEQADGKYILLGAFEVANGEPYSHVVRLMPDGTTDLTFDPGLGFHDEVMDALLQPDGKLVAGGYFTGYDTVSSAGVVRVNTSGNMAIVDLEAIAIDLYPNPTDGLITIRGEFEGKVEIRVLDCAGRSLYHGRVQGNGAEPMQVDLGTLVPGPYVLQLHTKDGMVTRMVVRE